MKSIDGFAEGFPLPSTIWASTTSFSGGFHKRLITCLNLGKYYSMSRPLKIKERRLLFQIFKQLLQLIWSCVRDTVRCRSRFGWSMGDDHCCKQDTSSIFYILQCLLTATRWPDQVVTKYWLEHACFNSIIPTRIFCYKIFRETMFSLHLKFDCPFSLKLWWCCNFLQP